MSGENEANEKCKQKQKKNTRKKQEGSHASAETKGSETLMYTGCRILVELHLHAAQFNSDP